MGKYYVVCRVDRSTVNRWILRYAGIWMPETKKSLVKILYRTYTVGIFLFVNLFFTSTEFLSLYYTYNNEYDLIKNISFALTHLMGAVKVIFFYFRGNKLKEIMGTLECEQFQYEYYNDKFNPGLISNEYKKTGIKYSILFFMLAHATLTSSYLPPTIATLFVMYDKNNEKWSLPKKLPYYSWMPFRYDTPQLYLIALGYQAIPMFSYAYSIVGMDSLFMNIMNCIGLNLTIIQKAFLTIRERVTHRINSSLLTPRGLHNSEELKQELKLEMKKICQHLQTIYKVCKELENIHKYLTLAQSIATIFILCSCLYLVSTTPGNSKQFYAEIVYMTAMGFQLILYCWFGNEITLKADKMSFYIWQCSWLTADTDFKKSMIFTMARVKKPLYMTAGNFAPLTLSTFVSIIKGSYSFFAVIKNTSK